MPGNPTSDHPLGRACDVTFGRLGTFAGPDDVLRGWVLASWLRANAAPLQVSYVIWQGRIWSPAFTTTTSISPQPNEANDAPRPVL